VSEISDTLLKQRLRNRVIEVLDMFSDQSSVEKIGSDEIIEFWYDYVDDEKLSFYDEPVFTKNELNALKRFHNLLECSYKKVPSTWLLTELASCEPWLQLRASAKVELEIFLSRGRFSEECEIT
jgi:hypothetical protein